MKGKTTMKHIFSTLYIRLFRLVVFALFLAVFPSQGFSGITLSVTHVPVDQLAIGDIDVEHFQNQNLFFTLQIESDSVRTVTLRFSANIQLSDANYENAVSFLTQPFQVPLTFSNLDIGRNSLIRTKPGSFVYSTEAKDRIQNIALSTGKMPAGTYTINLDLLDSTENIVASGSFEIVLRNLTRVQLLSPQDNSELTSNFPFFQWQYEGDSVEISVYEKLPHHSSNEEAVQGIPHIVRNSGSVDFPLGASSLQYPSSGQNVRSLEEGKTYVWKVRGFSHSIAGTNDVNSEIWQFNIASQQNRFVTGTDTTQHIVNQQVFDLLEAISDLSPELLQLLQNENLQPTGVFTIDGIPVSMNQLRELLSILHTNPDKLIGITIVE